jgi:UDP-glucose 4-epimerase
MRIIITGGAGFIGSHVADAYIALGHQVAIIDNLSTGSLQNIPESAVFHEADITDCAGLKEIFNSFKPDVISHHAAQISVVDSVENPSYDASINIDGSLNVWQCARDSGAQRFIFSSSGGAVYGQVETSPVSEAQEPNPMSPYGLSKMVFERYLTLLRSFSLPEPVILRYANVYGPRQGAQGEAGVVSIFSRRLLEDQPCTIFGDGTMTRDYVFVGDVAQANCLALTKGAGGVFNIGSGEQTSTVQLYDMLRKITKRGPERPEFAPERQGEVRNIALYCRAAEEGLGWKPATSLREGLDAVVGSLVPTHSA